MKIKFKNLADSDFSLLLSWLQAPHVKKWWHPEVNYTLDLVKEKYGTYVRGYKQIEGKQKQIHAFIIYCDEQPIGYIQYYNAYDFPRDGYELKELPNSLAAIDLFIGDEAYLGKGIGSKAIKMFIDMHVFIKYEHAFVDPELNNVAAILAYSRSGFKIMRSSSKLNIYWMLKSKTLDAEVKPIGVVFNQLAMREPLFHHPDKYGATMEDLHNMTREGFWEVGASGNVYTRKEVIDTLLARYNDPDYIDIWEAKEFDLIEISPNNYLLTYLLLQDESRFTRRATIWRRVNEQWLIIYHQGTLCSPGGPV